MPALYLIAVLGTIIIVYDMVIILKDFYNLITGKHRDKN